MFKYRPWITESLLMVAMLLLFGIIGNIERSVDKDIELARKNRAIELAGTYE